MSYKARPGQPPKYKDVEEVEQRIDAFFKDCDENNRPYTMTGLGIALGLDRAQLINYGSKEKYSHAIKKAREKCQNYAEEQLYKGKATAGVIFALKNNWGWADKQEIEVKQDTTIEIKLPEVLEDM